MTRDLPGAYRALARLSDAQLQALENEDLDAFWKLTDEREAVFATLSALEPESASLSEGDRTMLTQLIPAILLCDQHIEAHLGRLSSQTQAELAKLQTGMAALNSYAVGREREAYFIDRPS
jgi:hypothetical protein